MIRVVTVPGEFSLSLSSLRTGQDGSPAGVADDEEADLAGNRLLRALPADGEEPRRS